MYYVDAQVQKLLDLAPEEKQLECKPNYKTVRKRNAISKCLALFDVRTK